MTSAEVLYSLLRLSLTDSRPIEIGPDVDWQKVIDLSFEQGVNAISVDGYSKWLNEGAEDSLLETDESLEGLKFKWLVSVLQAEEDYRKKQEVMATLQILLSTQGLKCVLVKGISIADYYPMPSHRFRGDIDIYCPVDFEKVDDILKIAGSDYKSDYYRHTECAIDGISIENHKYLTDIRGHKRWHQLEKDLSVLAQEAMAASKEPIAYLGTEGRVFFFLYHAQSHLVFESLSLRFFTDWLMILQKEKQALESDWFKEGIRKYHLEKIAAVMTSVCVHHLGLSVEDIPACLKNATSSIDPTLEERILADTLRTDKEGFTQSTLKGRIGRFRRTVGDTWKIKEFIGVPAWHFALEKAFGLITCK